MKNPAVGMNVVDKVVDELFDFMDKYPLNIGDNVIIDATSAIKEEYEAYISDFRVLTSNIGVIVSDIRNTEWPDESGTIYEVRIFADDKIKSLGEINMTDMIGLYGVDLSKYSYLSKCQFRFNRLYNPEQIHMIPAIIKEYKKTYTKK